MLTSIHKISNHLQCNYFSIYLLIFDPDETLLRHINFLIINDIFCYDCVGNFSGKRFFSAYLLCARSLRLSPVRMPLFWLFSDNSFGIFSVHGKPLLFRGKENIKDNATHRPTCQSNNITPMPWLLIFLYPSLFYF